MQRGWTRRHTRSRTASAIRVRRCARWQQRPGACSARWVAGSAVAAARPAARRLGDRHRSTRLRTGHQAAAAVRRRRPRRRRRRARAATCSCSRCTRWPASPASSPAARCRCRPRAARGVSRWVHEHGGRIAIAFVVRRDDVLAERAGLPARHTLGGVAAFLRVSPALLLLGVLPHAIPELIALFLPLAAWIIASRRGEWEQLLAATVVTLAIAVPLLVVAALHRGLRLAAPVHDAHAHPADRRIAAGRHVTPNAKSLGCASRGRSEVVHVQRETGNGSHLTPPLLCIVLGKRREGEQWQALSVKSPTATSRPRSSSPRARARRLLGAVVWPLPCRSSGAGGNRLRASRLRSSSSTPTRTSRRPRSFRCSRSRR